MKVMIMGMDGYLGWTLSMYLSGRGHDVCGVDNMSRRKNVAEIGSWSATPIRPMEQRLKAYKKATGRSLRFYRGDLVEPSFTDLVVGK
jgi:UDP-sulfoquinovose synthase